LSKGRAKLSLALRQAQIVMKADCKDALVLALERGLAEPAGSWTFYNASPLPGIETEWKSAFDCEQHSRPEFLRLEQQGYAVKPQFVDEPNDGAIVLLGRNRKLNEATIKRAWNNCKPNTKLIVTGNKTAGIDSIRKWFSTHHAIEDSFSKYHAKVFWTQKSGEDFKLPELSKTIDDYTLSEGMFSADGPDKGSQLLVEHFDDRIKGEVADLGCGWGYLSKELLKQSNRVNSIDLFEADYHALEAAKINLAKTDIPTNFTWSDVTSEFKKRPYHWVIMNPPFHSGRVAEPELGRRFIQVAGSTLPSGGRLLMVANRNLPYEDTLQKTFKKFKQLEERDGFKVIEAVK